MLTNQRRALPEPGAGVEPQQRGYHGLGQPRHRGELQQGRGQHPGEASGQEQRRVQEAHLGEHVIRMKQNNDQKHKMLVSVLRNECCQT